MDGTIALLAAIILIENTLVFLFILPRTKGSKVSKTELRKFIAENPDMFDADVLEDITRIVQTRMRNERLSS